MKWIGQHIYDNISRFRSDVYLEDLATTTESNVLVVDSDGKVSKSTSVGGDITGITLVTNDESSVSGTSGAVAFNLAGGAGIDTSASGVTITIAADSASTTAVGVVELATTHETTTGTDSIRVVTPDGLKDGYQGSENVVTVGTIGTGVWNGTAIATDYLKHKSTFELAGYASADGTNYMMADIMSGNKAPFLHDETSIGANGTTADNPAAFLRAAGTVMPYDGTLKIWKGWAASAGGGTIDIGIFKYTPTADDATPDSLVLVKNTQFTAGGNDNLLTFSEASFLVAVTAGDILITAIKGSTNNKTAYFVSTLEIEWTS